MFQINPFLSGILNERGVIFSLKLDSLGAARRDLKGAQKHTITQMFPLISAIKNISKKLKQISPCAIKREASPIMPMSSQTMKQDGDFLEIAE